MTRGIFVVAFIAALWAAFSFPATTRAQAPCAPYAEMAKALEQQFGERPVWRGIETSGATLELWANDAAPSWSAVRIEPNGRACLVDTGGAWESVEPRPKERSA